MKIIRQKQNEKCCGQCCVAMITNKPLSEIIERYGHNSTSNLNEAKEVLVDYGYDTRDIKKVDNRKNYDLPLIAMVRIEKKGRKNGHFIVHYVNSFYDSCEGEFYDKRSLISYYNQKYGGNWRISHYLSIGKSNNSA